MEREPVLFVGLKRCLARLHLQRQIFSLDLSVSQWRRQDLLRGGAKLEIMSWGTHGGLQGRVQQLLDD